MPFKRDFSLCGDYRNIVVKPTDLTYKIIDYTDKMIDLTQSDWDLIKPQDTTDKPDLTDNESSAQNLNALPKLKAICVEYSLPVSSYATMALREIINEV